jgi:hypothetical protein
MGARAGAAGGHRLPVRVKISQQNVLGKIEETREEQCMDQARDAVMYLIREGLRATGKLAPLVPTAAPSR